MCRFEWTSAWRWTGVWIDPALERMAFFPGYVEAKVWDIYPSLRAFRAAGRAHLQACTVPLHEYRFSKAGKQTCALCTVQNLTADDLAPSFYCSWLSCAYFLSQVSVPEN